MLYVKEENNLVFAECQECGIVMRFRKNSMRYQEDIGVYLFDEGVECFCGSSSDRIIEAPKKERKQIQYVPQNTVHYGTPRCPTCGSERVERISVGSKVVGGAMFGLFSSNVRKSYVCKNCKYKW